MLDQLCSSGTYVTSHSFDPSFQYSSFGSDNGLAPARRQAIIWTNAGLFTDASVLTLFQCHVHQVHISMGLTVNAVLLTSTRIHLDPPCASHALLTPQPWAWVPALWICALVRYIRMGWVIQQTNLFVTTCHFQRKLRTHNDILRVLLYVWLLCNQWIPLTKGQ